jgi:hypothetical protein
MLSHAERGAIFAAAIHVASATTAAAATALQEVGVYGHAIIGILICALIARQARCITGTCATLSTLPASSFEHSYEHDCLGGQHHVCAKVLPNLPPQEILINCDVSHALCKALGQQFGARLYPFCCNRLYHQHPILKRRAVAEA